MPLHDLGYRGWSGWRMPSGTRWMVITTTGVQRAWQSRWLRRMLLFAWLPAFWFGVAFFLWEQSVIYPEFRHSLAQVLRHTLEDDGLAHDLSLLGSDNPSTVRGHVWATLLHSFFRHPQAVVMVMIVGLIAPPLISQDIRSRAFLLYFSRPLNRSEYILGKLMTIWIYLALTSTIPALALYVLGVLLSPHLDVVYATWDLPLRILAASASYMIPTGALALCTSSLTQETRYAGFAWFTIWILGWITYGILNSAELMSVTGPYHDERWSLLSLFHTLGRVQNWIFGFASYREVAGSAMILLVITILSLIILYRRVSAPMRA